MNQFPYIYEPTGVFEKKLEYIQLHDPPGYERIIKTRDRLLGNPMDADGKMRGLFNGRFKKYVGRSGYRIIYYWCELCRKENRKRVDAFENCETIPDRSVIFFDVYHKKDSKKYKRQTSPLY